MKRVKSKKITDSARGEDCQVRIPGVCNFDPATTIASHLNGGGMGTKHNNIFIAYCCSDCHNTVDWAKKSNFSDTEIKLMHHEGVVRTQYILLEKGLIKA
jgi:hypothetical protein